MKTSRVIQYIAAAILLSIACICMLSHAPSVGVWALASLVLMKQKEFTRPIPRKELINFWVFFAILFAINMAMIIEHAMKVIHQKSLTPEPAGLPFFHHPAFVIPSWLLLMTLLFMKWRSERKLARN